MVYIIHLSKKVNEERPVAYLWDVGVGRVNEERHMAYTTLRK